MMPSYPSSQSELIQQSQIELITNLQRSGQLNEILAVVLKLEEIVDEGKNKPWRNFFLNNTPALILEDIKEQIDKSPYSIRSLLRQMLFYREKRIEKSIKAFKHFRISGIIFISTLFTTSVTQYIFNVIFGWNLNWLWAFSPLAFFYFILRTLFYIIWCRYTDIKFVKSFKDLVVTLEKASKDLLNHMSQSLRNILEYSEELTKIRTDVLLNEEQQNSALLIRDNLLFLASKVAEKEFELKSKYIVRDAELQEDLAKIQARIKEIKNKPEVKRVQEEFYSKGLTREYEMALDSIRSVIQEAMEVVKDNKKQYEKMHKLLKPLTIMASRFESKGEAAWSQTDLGSLSEVLGQIAKFMPKIEINISQETNTVNENKPTTYNTKVETNNSPNSPTAIGTGATAISTQNNYAAEQKQNLTEAAAEIQKLLQQLEESYPTETLSQKAVIAEEAIKQIESNPTFKQRVVSVIKAMGVQALIEAIDHPVANILREGIEAFKEPI